jgi:hypothetical protein
LDVVVIRKASLEGLNIDAIVLKVRSRLLSLDFWTLLLGILHIRQYKIKRFLIQELNVGNHGRPFVLNIISFLNRLRLIKVLKNISNLSVVSQELIAKEPHCTGVTVPATISQLRPVVAKRSVLNGIEQRCVQLINRLVNDDCGEKLLGGEYAHA